MSLAETATARAPTRIDLAGGTLDIWPLCQLEPDAVTVNLAIDRYAHVRVRRIECGLVLEAEDQDVREKHPDFPELRIRSQLPLLREAVLDLFPEGGVELSTRSGVPAGSGLGGSSTLLVAALHALATLRGRALSTDELLSRAMNREARVIGVPTGTQDYLAAIHGDVGVIRFPTTGPIREPAGIGAARVADRLVLAYTGLPHESAINNWAITKGYVDGDPGVREPMADIAAAGRRLAQALQDGDLDAAGLAVADEWQARKRLAPGVTTPLIERLARHAGGAGALATKVCGAGGGGCVFFWCREGAREAVEQVVTAAGAELMPFAAARDGVQ